MTVETYDLIVLGAGPAGMSAAITATACGLKTLLLDEQAKPGGQIYRNVSQAPQSVAKLLGPDYEHGKVLADRLSTCGAELRFGATVWDVARDLTVTAQMEGKPFQVRAPQMIAATGAMERASPLQGWTLPGVMNAGAAQIAIKNAAAVPTGQVVLVGGGPLLLLVACQLLDAGVAVNGIVQTSPESNALRALRHLPAALLATSYLAKGARMLWRLRRAGVAMYSGAELVRVDGDGRARGVTFHQHGKSISIDAELVLLHHGVVPNTQLGRLLRIDHEWDASQLAWRPRLDAWGESSLQGFRIAGDGAGIAGALAAEPSGALAALGAAHGLGRLDAQDLERLARPLRARLASQLHIRPFLDALYRPPEWITNPADETVVCRCEEVTAGRIREMAALGCQGPNQTKFFSRCGMGPCQGRMCGLAVTQILSAELGRPPSEVGAYQIRAPLKPIPLKSIAAFAAETASAVTEPMETS